MKTFNYDDIFEFNGGAYYDYLDHKGNDKQALNSHILETIELMLKDIPDSDDFITFSDYWLTHLRKARYHSSTVGLGKQSILDQLAQIVESMCHSQKTRRISERQIDRWNRMMDDLKTIMEKHYPKVATIWIDQQIEMKQKNKQYGNPILESLIAK